MRVLVMDAPRWPIPPDTPPHQRGQKQRACCCYSSPCLVDENGPSTSCSPELEPTKSVYLSQGTALHIMGRSRLVLLTPHGPCGDRSCKGGVVRKMLPPHHLAHRSPPDDRGGPCPLGRTRTRAMLQLPLRPCKRARTRSTAPPRQQVRVCVGVAALAALAVWLWLCTAAPQHVSTRVWRGAAQPMCGGPLASRRAPRH